jgi:hypothetical protein
MLVGAYPFEDPGEPKNFRKTLTVSRPKFHPANVDMDTTFTFDLRLALIMPLNFSFSGFSAYNMQFQTLSGFQWSADICCPGSSWQNRSK